ncbi:SNF2 family N-terminal domain-containing protein [Lasiosphaeria miniovina]|uniref:SNF2 family N-terminal domain-containing protein n=1 Tax=Lasiosphaeria miniovina TaxID=1954250 RepID=A0AA40DHB8_9PEZI|nr:SNF2 family N-terminal domain-containing protein [Lasiosphaeria miniovina]KAK0703564.1 SNF2 family N-terminal domain-containing protein [Lasiosphaeria miniovina]
MASSATINPRVPTTPFVVDSALVSQLEDDLTIQRAVLASLEDVPQSPDLIQQISSTKSAIVSIQHRLAEARRGQPAVPASAAPATMDLSRSHGSDPFRALNHNTRTSTPSGMSSLSGSSPAIGHATGSAIPSLRKRSFGSSHLEVGNLGGSENKSRRTTPSPGDTGHSTPSSNFMDSDQDFGDVDIIDLTEDNDEWRVTIKRQREEEERLNRIKEERDRDEAVARRLAESPSHASSGLSQHSTPSRSNAFDRILGRSSQQSSLLGQGNAFTNRLDSGLTRSAIEDEPIAVLASSLSSDYFQGMTNVKHEPISQGRNWVPGAFVDDDDDDDDRVAKSSVLVNRPRPLTSLSHHGIPPNLALPPPPGAFGSSDTQRYATGLPPIEFVRQNAMVKHEPVYPPLGSSSQYGSNRNLQLPGSQFFNPYGSTVKNEHQNPYGSAVKNEHQNPYGSAVKNEHQNPYGSAVTKEYQNPLASAGYYGDGSSTRPYAAFDMYNPSLSNTISQVNNYDFNALTDGFGNPLDSRLVNFLDDYVNDPRKTEDEIHQLLSNIRPDMDIPEEERGETPEALKYPLYPHQQLAIKWMSEMEEGSNKGGILADDMGLGKTISTLALMVSRPSFDNIKTNLIIGPVALIKQWEQEIKKKLKGSHKLSVFLLHQKKEVPFSTLKGYDVVLTTFGSIASEWKKFNKHIEQRQSLAGYQTLMDEELHKKCPLLHPKSKFYRVILDEAQCIKNKDTQSSRGVSQIASTYRWCLTGTPMMNGVTELYPLIRFLRIKPYCDLKLFTNAFKSLVPRAKATDLQRSNAMKQLRIVLKAIMLRRMKNSKIDGKPILSLPDKTEHEDNVVFSNDEQSFYQDLEQRSQVIFNKYLRSGTVGKNYSNILVLLLRLRQACCHPHLMDFECVGANDVSVDDMVALAKSLERPVVERIKAIEAFECPICYDAVQDPTLLFPCGHDTCSECFASLTDNTAQNNIRSGNENGAAKCPVCRGPAEPSKIINYSVFQKVYMPEKVQSLEGTYEQVEELGDDDDDDDDDDDSLTDTGSNTGSEADNDDDDDDDTESLGSLKDFIVGGDEEDDDAQLDAELAAYVEKKKQKRAMKTKKAKPAKKPVKKSNKNVFSAKSKGKAAEVKPHMLKHLRIEAGKNQDARRRYMHYLRDNWEDSAKVTEVIELLRHIQESDEKTIIFSQWTSLLDLIECQIRYKLGIKYCRYTGGMTRGRRDEAVTDFTENPRNRVMLVSLRAGNAGLNLTVASRVIICDPFWNPYVEMQAIDRAHRIGQQREVQVHRILVKETVEDRIIKLQVEKRNLVDAALDEGESKNVGRLSERELAYLFGVNPSRR